MLLPPSTCEEIMFETKVHKTRPRGFQDWQYQRLPGQMLLLSHGRVQDRRVQGKRGFFPTILCYLLFHPVSISI